MMDNRTIQAISSGPIADCTEALLDFNRVHEKAKDFKDIDSKSKNLLWDALFSRLKTVEDPAVTQLGLNALRLLSREKGSLEKAMTEDRAGLLLTLSGLKSEGEIEAKLASVEGLKVIFNMVFQSSIIQVMFISEGILSHLIKRIEDFTNSPNLYPREFQYFVSRILFLITALCQDTACPRVRNSLNGLTVLCCYMERKVEEIRESWDDMGADIVCEMLKVFYNLISNLVPKNKRNESSESEIDDDDMQELKRLTKNVRLLLVNFSFELVEGESPAKKDDIQRHSIDILAAIPTSCFEEFTPMFDSNEAYPPFSFENKDMTGVENTLTYLNEKLDGVKKSALPPDNIASPLLALHNMAINNRCIRKYLKLRILPPLKRADVENLPEEGRTIRNKLVALLTSPITHITDLVANLLFVLCKERVGKLVKYTGYGNAAGLLANRGLMLGGRPPPGKYSDDSEDGSDTEEYREVEHMINHIEGRIQQERPDPMEGMTDEQKEYEALKLISAIDKMDRYSGGIKPCRIGADGRPEPIEHVLQLQEALENPMKGLRRDDSDSDSD